MHKKNNDAINVSFIIFYVYTIKTCLLTHEKKSFIISVVVNTSALIMSNAPLAFIIETASDLTILSVVILLFGLVR